MPAIPGSFPRQLEIRNAAKKSLGRDNQKTDGRQGGSDGDVRRTMQKDPSVQTPGASCSAGAVADTSASRTGEVSAHNSVHIFSGKAAPSDQLAKQIIRLIHIAGSIVNNDPAVEDTMKVVFLPDYGVSLAEKIIPAADLSEQIATPGQEASGTGNAKFAINGSLLMASKSGSNIEIIGSVGAENVVCLRTLRVRASVVQPISAVRSHFCRSRSFRHIQAA